MSNKFLDIRPSNLPPNGIVSYKGGNPVITFDISEDDAAVLIGGSVRISGALQVTTDGATTPTSADTLTMDSRLGVFSCIDQLVLSSYQTKQTIEHIRHYNRFMSTYLPVVSSNQDLIGHVGQAALTLPSRAGVQQGVVRDGNTNANEFSFFPVCGLLAGSGNLPLDQGLTLSIHLAPDAAVLWNTSKDATQNPNCQYSLSDLKLTCEIHRPQGKELQALQSTKTRGFEYSSVSSYYSTINSTNAILNYSLGLSRVQGVFCNFIKSEYLNNLAYNSMMTLMPIKQAGGIANVNQVIFTRGGERYPMDFNVDTNYKLDPKVSVVDPQVSRNFLNSVVPFVGNNRTSISPANTNRDWTITDDDLPEGGLVWGVGQSYTTTGDDGADFSRANWGLQMDVELTDNSPNSVFVYVHAKNTLLFGQGGLQVIS
tara:strand:+ start:55 stop:1335 length:1281 start_codon:yes stop_codon:yes gene_type:complete